MVFIHSVDREECELYNFSTAAEGSGDELAISKPKRIGKKKTFDDFVEGMIMKQLCSRSKIVCV